MKVRIRFTIAPSCMGCNTEEGSEVWEVPNIMSLDDTPDMQALYRHIEAINKNFASVYEVVELPSIIDRYREWAKRQ